MTEGDSLLLPLRRQVADVDSAGSRVWRDVTSEVQWPLAATALVLCDVWDRHWCAGAEARLEQLLPRMQEVAALLRARGALIVHAPSETMAFYADSPARRRILESPLVAPPAVGARDDPPLPFATPGGGCDTGSAAPANVWSRQHPAITIDDSSDVVSDDGRELYSYYRRRGIRHLLIMGVHTNMCVLNRSFAIKQMVRWGIDIALLRDLTDAMYDPALPPYVSHAEGTRLVIEYIEKFWCPTVESSALWLRHTTGPASRRAAVPH